MNHTYLSVGINRIPQRKCRRQRVRGFTAVSDARWGSVSSWTGLEQCFREILRLPLACWDPAGRDRWELVKQCFRVQAADALHSWILYLWFTAAFGPLGLHSRKWNWYYLLFLCDTPACNLCMVRVHWPSQRIITVYSFSLPWHWYMWQKG